MIAGTIIFQCFPQQLMYLFDANEEMMNIGVPALRIISLSFIFAGISLVLSAVFQSVDHANKSLMITLLRQMYCCCQLSIYGKSIWIERVVVGISYYRSSCQHTCIHIFKDK